MQDDPPYDPSKFRIIPCECPVCQGHLTVARPPLGLQATMGTITAVDLTSRSITINHERPDGA